MKKGLEFLLAGTLVLSTVFGSGCKNVKEEWDRARPVKEVVKVVNNTPFSIHGRRRETFKASHDGKHALFELPESATTSKIVIYNAEEGSLVSLTDVVKEQIQGRVFSEIGYHEEYVMGNQYFAENFRVNNGNQINQATRIKDLFGNVHYEFNQKSVNYQTQDILSNGIALIQSKDNNKGDCIFLNLNTGERTELSDLALGFEFRPREEDILPDNKVIIRVNNGHDYFIIYDTNTNQQVKVEESGKSIHFENLISQDEILLREFDQNAQIWKLRTYNTNTQNKEDIFEAQVDEYISIRAESKNGEAVVLEIQDQGKEDFYVLNLRTKKKVKFDSKNRHFNIERLENGKALVEYVDKTTQKETLSIADTEAGTISQIGFDSVYIGEVQEDGKGAIAHYEDVNNIYKRSLVKSDGTIQDIDNLDIYCWHKEELIYDDYDSSTGKNKVRAQNVNTGAVRDLYTSQGGGLRFLGQKGEKIMFTSEYNTGTSSAIKIMEHDLGTGDTKEIQDLPYDNLDRDEVDKNLTMVELRDWYINSEKYAIYNKKTGVLKELE
jgi:hypothetical protein